jgi:SAM-dependent methyltransferase
MSARAWSRPVPEGTILDYGADTGTRLKHYSTAADVEYWTERWAHAVDVSYGRERRGHLPHQLRATWLRWVEPRSRILEAGCGLGHFTVAADALGYKAEGLDWSDQTIGRLRQIFPAIAWHVGDVRHLPFSTGRFDAIYSPGVCEHFEEGPQQVLAETHRVLKRGGIAVISTPCFNAWMQRRAAQIIDPAVPAEARFHEYAFTTDGMAGLLQRLGFEVLQIRPYGAIDTVTRYGGWPVPRPLRKPVAYSLDCLPVVRDLGSTCIWVARKGAGA